MMFAIRPFETARDEGWVSARLDGAWGGRMQARRDELIDVLQHEGLVAEENGDPVGFVFWHTDDPASGTELSLIWAFRSGQGIGTALVAEMLRRVEGDIWVVTTNANAEAVAFYQGLGFAVREVRTGAVDRARRTLKPEIPLVGASGLPVHDEVELVLSR